MKELRYNFGLPVISFTQHQFDELSEDGKISLRVLIKDLRKQGIVNILDDLNIDEMIFLSKILKEKIGESE